MRDLDACLHVAVEPDAIGDAERSAASRHRAEGRPSQKQVKGCADRRA